MLGFNTCFFISLHNRILFGFVYLVGHTLWNIIAFVYTSTLTLDSKIDERGSSLTTTRQSYLNENMALEHR